MLLDVHMVTVPYCQEGFYLRVAKCNLIMALLLSTKFVPKSPQPIPLHEQKHHNIGGGVLVE